MKKYICFATKYTILSGFKEGNSSANLEGCSSKEVCDSYFLKKISSFFSLLFFVFSLPLFDIGGACKIAIPMQGYQHR